MTNKITDPRLTQFMHQQPNFSDGFMNPYNTQFDKVQLNSPVPLGGYNSGPYNSGLLQGQAGGMMNPYSQIPGVANKPPIPSARDIGAVNPFGGTMGTPTQPKAPATSPKASSTPSTSTMVAQLTAQFPQKFDEIKKMTAAELAAMYGIMYKREDIEGVLNQATAAKFNELDAQTAQLRDQQLTDYSSQFDQYLAQARQNREGALKSGLSRGANAAKDIMSQMQVQQQGAQNQSFYQQSLGELVNQRGTQLGADKYNAMAMSNDIGMNLGNIAANFHQSDVAGLTGYQQYLASLANSQAMLGSANIQANAATSANDSWMTYLDGLNLTPTQKIQALTNPQQFGIDFASQQKEVMDRSKVVQNNPYLVYR